MHLAIIGSRDQQNHTHPSVIKMNESSEPILMGVVSFDDATRILQKCYNGWIFSFTENVIRFERTTGHSKIAITKKENTWEVVYEYLYFSAPRPVGQDYPSQNVTSKCFGEIFEWLIDRVDDDSVFVKNKWICT